MKYRTQTYYTDSQKPRHAFSTFKRDYMSRMNLCDAPTVLAQSAEAFEHFNGIRPHSSLGMMSPKECQSSTTTPPTSAN
ncbi:integrase core domain-containing protein [Comamonas guangdongensis]|uniref:integrase core domain-containing protein n=1 Tax=Comamonas guangdongensis TaxID=510515 RepID=UPI003F6E0A95